MAIEQVIEYKRDSTEKLKQDGPYLVPSYVYTRYFQVVCSTPDTSHSDIRAHADIPKKYTPHPENDGVIVKNVSIKQGDDEESYVYEVQVDYDDEYTGEDPEQPDDNNPLNQPVVIRGAFAEYDQVMVRDINGTLIRNSALDAFDPPVTRKGGALRFTMTKNYASLNIALLKSYKNAINSDAWFGQAAYTVRIANINFERVVETREVSEGVFTRFVYFPHTFEFELAEEGFGSDGTWKKYALDQGYQYYFDDRYWPFTDTTGLPVTTPRLLDGEGNIGDRDNPQFLSFDIYRQLPFTALGLL